MRITRRRVVLALRGGRGAAARPAPEARADWRAIVARGSAAPAGPAAPAPARRGRADHRSAALVAVALSLTLTAQAVALLTAGPPAVAAAGDEAVFVTGPRVVTVRPPKTRAAIPVRVTVRRIGVRSALVPLGLLRDGSLETPADYDRAGFYTGGSRPGERGPAVVVGHVDSRTGPAVFFRLRELRKGDVIRISRADGTEVSYTVQTVRTYPKNAFPTKAVYGPTARPALRLITCGGAFDAAAGSYRENVVVFAGLTPGRAA